jgi:hypothetical protein
MTGHGALKIRDLFVTGHAKSSPEIYDQRVIASGNDILQIGDLYLPDRLAAWGRLAACRYQNS